MKEKQSFEEDLKRLQKIVEELSSGKLSLGRQLEEKYEEGVKTRARIIFCPDGCPEKSRTPDEEGR